MSREQELDEITKFFFNTCRLRPQLSKAAVQAAVECTVISSVRKDDQVAYCIPLTTGSVAEFYIEPMLPHVGDVDVMYHLSTQLAAPRGYPPPTQLPDEFHNYVNVYEIIDSDFPGYVYLELRYLLTECSDDGKYNAVECDRGQYFVNHIPQAKAHGPALLQPANEAFLGRDGVLCVRCLMWPPQAADWPTRHRNCNWPDSETVDHVVSNGCDVVTVAHRQCRQHEVKRKYQCRMSFSRAENVLLNSWMPEQQIVYHMLRFFFKSQRLTDSADDSEAGKLSNYHIKTLILWACEQKPSSWWTDDLNYVRLCVELLRDMADWLSNVQFPHYFLKDCNLVDKTYSVEKTASELSTIDESLLSIWYINNYIRKCSCLCPGNVSRLFNDISTSLQLKNAVSAVINWRLNNALEECWRVFDYAEDEFISVISDFSLTVHSCNCWITELEKMDARLTVYFMASAFLHIAFKISKEGFTDEFLNVLATLIGQVNDKSRHRSNSSSVLSLSKAAKLMKVTANKSHSTMQLMEIELSKSYLYRALRCKDSDSDSINCLTNVYLAVLCYTTGQHQTAIDHCTLVTRSQDHSQCSSHVQGELLPKVHDDIDNILGLSVLYQYVLSCALNQQQRTQHVNVFTAELFAEFLQNRCFALTEALPRGFEHPIGNTHLYIADVLALKSLVCRPLTVRNRNCQKNNLCENELDKLQFDATELVQLLQKSAVEHLTSFRQSLARDFGSVATIVTTDFEAMYAYKDGDYQRCLQLSTQNVHTLLYARRMRHIWIIPEFIQLMNDDDDIVSLTALTLIVNPKCSRELHGDRYVTITQMTQSLYLMAQCQMKLHHSVTSLAQILHYIKVAQRRHPAGNTLDHLTLKLIKRKVLMHVTTVMMDA